jgi:hypothetical protein
MQIGMPPVSLQEAGIGLRAVDLEADHLSETDSWIGEYSEPDEAEPQADLSGGDSERAAADKVILDQLIAVQTARDANEPSYLAEIRQRWKRRRTG